MLPQGGGEALKGDHRVERRDLDADHVRQSEDRVQGGVVVGDTACRVVQIEGDDGQLRAQRVVVGGGVSAPRKCEEGVGAARPGLARHLHRVGAGDDHLVGNRAAPRCEHNPALLGGEVQAPPRVRPHRHAGDWLRRHPARVGALCVFGDGGFAKRHRHRRNEARLETASDRWIIQARPASRCPIRWPPDRAG